MPYGPSRRELAEGDLVVLDIGSTYGGYTADESRTFVVGEASAEQQALFAVARAAEDAVFDALRPGVSVAEVYERAEAVVMQGWPSHFAPGSLVLPGFVGHGLGLELDEPPVLWSREETRLKPGMTLAIEIEVTTPELDLASGAMVKIEDTVLVGENGVEVLTVTPRELIAVG
jgi:Xaa-Pro aminopeptidase